jgi:hypothetical protein
MSSTLGCIGMAVDDVDALDALVGRLLPDARVVARAADLQARRWTDPSGASLTLTLQAQDGADADEAGVLVDLVPSYVDAAGAGGVRLGRLVPHGPTLAADLVDADGQLVTRVACDLAQSIVAEVSEPRDARITALGLEVAVHEDADAFARSDDSVLGTPEPGEAPQRLATESLVSYGLFGEPDTAEPRAFVSGTVLAAVSQESTVGQRFHAVRVSTVGGTMTVCLAADEHPEPPPVGSVVAGTCYLVLDVPGLWPQTG